MPREYKLLGIILVLAIGLGWLLFHFGGTNAPQTVPLQDRADAYSKGSATARITLTEFADFQCPACRAARSVIDQVMADHPQDIKLVFRHFPLTTIHPLALLAAEASEAAGHQGKFWEMHDLLYARQEEWGSLAKSSSSQEALALFNRYATELSLDLPKFSKDIQTNAYNSIIDGDMSTAAASGVSATPQFFVNGKKVSEPSHAALKAAVDAALK